MGEEPLNIAKLHALESNVKVDYQKITAEEKAYNVQKHLMLLLVWKC